MLRALGEDVVALREEHPEGIKDLALFAKLKGANLVFVSTDTSQLSRDHEARALKESKITALYFGPFFEKRRLWDQAVWLVQQWPKISGFVRGAAPGTCAEIKQNGRAIVRPL